MNYLAPAFALLIAGMAADVATTLRGLRAGRRELNPMLADLMRAIGPLPALLVTKVFVLAACVAAAVGLPGAQVEVAIGIGAVGALHALAALWNARGM